MARNVDFGAKTPACSFHQLIKKFGQTCRTMASILRVVRRRPLSSLGLVGASTTLGCAAIVEQRAEQKEREYLAIHRSSLLPRKYDAKAIDSYWMERPLTSMGRLGTVTYELLPLALAVVKDFYLMTPTDPSATQQSHAIRLREALTRLGPAFVKAGQQLSIRPDLLPAIVLKELQKLCDAVEPVPDDVALQVLRDELGDAQFAQLDDLQLVASASLGQVYKAQIKGETVAIKVQRPNMRRAFSQDLFLLHQIGVAVDAFTSVFTNQPPFHTALYQSFAQGSYMELDYEHEAANQNYFREALAQHKVVCPKVFEQFTTQRVLTSQWIEGVKLADATPARIRQLIPVGVELFLVQLLDIGAFHADPHPGNLLVTPDGQLALLDFGLCAEVDVKARHAMTKAIVHLLYRDFDALVHEDSKELGFLPHDFDTTELQPILVKILTVGLVGSDLRKRQRKLMEISNELNEVFFRYPFSVPPFFALITRGLGLLEGIALSGDPDFDIFHASAPFARRRAVHLLGNSWRRTTTKQSV